MDHVMGLILFALIVVFFLTCFYALMVAAANSEYIEDDDAE